MLIHKKINKIKNYYLFDLNFFDICHSTSYFSNFEKISSLYPDLKLTFGEFYSFIGGVTKKEIFGCLRDFYDAGVKIRNMKSVYQEIIDLEDISFFKACDSAINSFIK